MTRCLSALWLLRRSAPAGARRAVKLSRIEVDVIIDALAQIDVVTARDTDVVELTRFIFNIVSKRARDVL